MRPAARLPHVALAAIAASLVISLSCLVAVTPLTSLVLYFVGGPLFAVGLAAGLAAVYLDLKAHRVL